nr:MAG TPA: hypothetical protein [Caudoviricetes sp.]
MICIRLSYSYFLCIYLIYNILLNIFLLKIFIFSKSNHTRFITGWQILSYSLLCR